MKDNLIKRRNYVDWNSVRLYVCDLSVDLIYWPFKANHPKLSDNRISYICMLSVFGKKKMDYFRLTHDYSVFGVPRFNIFDPIG